MQEFLKNPISIIYQTWPEGTIPYVSVVCWVHNDKDYIKESIEGILIQKTSFPIEIIIQDDASTDGTKEIIDYYEKSYHNLFNNILNLENQYSLGVDITKPPLLKAIGKYIALLHGDDYWTDPLKLQKQVDFLEKNLDYSMCFHGVLEEKENKLFDSYNIHFDGSETRLFEDFLTGDGFFPRTCATIFRNTNEIKKGIFCINNLTDLSIKLIPAFLGKTKYINETMGVYRIHSSSSMAQYKIRNYLNDQINELIELIEFFKPDKRVKYLIKLRNTYQFQLAGYDLLYKNYKSGFNNYYNAILNLKNGIRNKKALLFFPGIAIYLLMPSTIKLIIIRIFNITNPIYTNTI